MNRQARILVAELIGTMILILGGPGTVIFGQFLGFQIGVLGSVARVRAEPAVRGVPLRPHLGLPHQPGGDHRDVGAEAHADRKDVPAYIVGQIVGAALGAFIIWAILETGDNGGR